MMPRWLAAMANNGRELCCVQLCLAQWAFPLDLSQPAITARGRNPHQD
jgi:hypothetical protein